MKPILILGLGNPLQGDDGIGCRVAEDLEQGALLATTPTRDDVEIMDGGTPGVGLLNFLQGRKRVIIVDAAEMGVAPGEFRRFTPEQITLTGSAQRFSLHRSGVADALALAQELRIELPEIICFGVQPASVEWRAALSPPVQAAVPQVIEAVLNELSGHPEEFTMANEKILIIDDDDDLVLAMRLPLQAAGYKVSRAANGEEGLEKVKEVKPDLIILDVMMDSTTAGFQVSLALRSPDPHSEYKAFSKIPILMLTAIHTTTSMRFGPDQEYLPVDAFLEKPIEPSKLLEQVRKHLKK